MSHGPRPTRSAPRPALILANRLPFPLDDGWNVRAFHVTRAVGEFCPTVLAVGGGASPEELRTAESALGAGIRVIGIPFPRSYTVTRVLAGLVSPFPVHYWNYQSLSTRRTVRELARQHRFGLALAFNSFMWPYTRAVGPAGLRMVDTHNVDSLTLSRYVQTMDPGPRRFYSELTRRKLRWFERRVYREADAVWVCSDEDARLASAIAPTARLAVIPNGVDSHAFAVTTPPPMLSQRLLFFGRLDYYPNLDGLRHFCEQIFPLIRRQLPEVELLVAGRGVGREIVELCRPGSGITLLGRVEHIASALERASVVVVPLRLGGGTRLKILEALATARPVVATTIGAEGLSLRNGEEIILADAREDFAAAVIRLLQNPEAAIRLGAAGRQAVVCRYDWARIGALIRQELERSFDAQDGREDHRVED